MDNEIQHVPQGGPQTETGKAVSKFNALTHGILRDTLTEYERDEETGILDELHTELSPRGVLENILLERIATNYIKLHRIAKAEREFVLSVLNPRKVVRRRTDVLGQLEEGLNTYEETVENEGYTPVVSSEAVERLYGIYARYETNLENRLYRAVRELREQRAAKIAA